MDRYTRRKLKSDKFTDTIMTSTDWAVENRGKLIGGGILLVIAVLAVSGFSYRQNTREHEANDQLSKAFLTLEAKIRTSDEQPKPDEESYASEAERTAAANKEFNQVASAYPRTDAGVDALYMSGVTAAMMKDNPNAESQLKSAAKKGNKDVSSLAKLALANFYHGNGRDQDAIRVLEDLRAHPSNAVPASMAGLQLASIYEKTDPAKAKTIYGDIQKSDNGEAKKVAMQHMMEK